ncbi:hypothetical protein D9615_000656 [Tricholomella constricta]|uniref:Uncharacterized protein n=1 Tax=Tricholomella constricta TaxID=117010 RepID=A0A8H5HRW9_9AGAR|nr:hypothetical protein D9615_000656 [Tricholomella constricta]
MDGDSSDILGGPTFPNARDAQSGRWSGLSFGVKSAFVLAVLLVLYVVGIRAWETFLVWREKAYKLSMRRRHGIPDNDHRPFNVAYAAVVRARQENEAVVRRAKLQEMVHDQQNALPNQNIRQRHGIQRDESAKLNPIPGRYESADIFSSSSVNASNINYSYSSLSAQPSAGEHYNPNPVVRIAEPEVDDSPPKSGPSRRPIRKYITVSNDERRKRGFDGDESDEPDHTKKTRMEDEEFNDGEEEAEWYERQQVPQRGSKRVLGDEDNDDTYPSTHTRDKRPRKFSLEKTPQYTSEDMDIDEYGDDVAELRPTVRGKKRDRAEAGSTFGGDDDDSAHEAEAENDSKTRRRHRKRRTYAKRKSDVATRGQKRDRGLAEGDSDLEDDDGMALKVSRKKRGKRSVSASEQGDGSDVSMDNSQTSSRRGRPRRIGDEWESNGVKYKIGPNGQRLRQTLVKKARQKFNMPEDSQHPDCQVNLEVCIETWLTEEEYREAKDQLLLAWQDSNKPSAEPETPSRESQDLPAVAGKDLLWKSTSAVPTPGTSTPQQITPPPGTPQPKQKDREHSIASNAGLRINPFQKQVSSGKRIASTARVSSVFNGVTTNSSNPASPNPSLTDSTNGSPRHKMFSKWEKQDLEAKAMMKMREANRKKEEIAHRLKEEKEKAEKLKKEQEAAAAVKLIPAITVTKAEEARPAQAGAKLTGFSFGPPPATDAAKKDAPSPSGLFKSAVPGPQTQQPKAAEKPPTSFSFAPQPQSSSKPAAFPSNSSPLGGLPPADNLFTKKPDEQQSKPPLSFGFPAPSTPASNPAFTPAPASSTSTQSFSFGPPPSQPSQPSQPATKNEMPAPTTGGASLFSRLAPAGASTQPSAQPSQPTPTFSFAKQPAAEAPKPTSVFGNLGVPQPAPQKTSQSGPASTNAPKFSFGLPNKPAAPASMPAPAPTSAFPTSSSSLTGALGNAEPKPAPAPASFSFKTPSAPTESSNTGAAAAASGATTAPKFSFGAPLSSSSTSAFGASNTFGAKAPATTTTTPAAGTSSTSAFGGSNPFAAQAPTTTSTATPAAAPSPSVFAGFGGGTASSSTSTFPAASQTSTASPFGSSNLFGGGGASNPFGASTTAKAGEAPKASPFSFGNSTPSSTTPAAAAATGDNATKPLFSFATPGSTTPAFSSTTAPAAGSSTSGGFSFGDAAKNPTTPQASQPAPGQSVFGKPSTGPSAFGFGATSATSGNSAFGAFGKAPTSTGQQQQ